MSDSGSNNGHYLGVLLEDMDTKLDLILESQQALSTVPAQLKSIDERLIRVEDDVSAIKAAVGTNASGLDNHEARLKTLENAN